MASHLRLPRGGNHNLLVPEEVSFPQPVFPDISRGATGKTQSSASIASGVQWQEIYPPMSEKAISELLFTEEDGGFPNIKEEIKAYIEAYYELITFCKTASALSRTIEVQHLYLPGSGLPPLGGDRDSDGNYVKPAPALGPYINGANQSGDTIQTNGWNPSKNGVMKPGDIFRIKNVALTFETQNIVNSDAGGNAEIKIFPTIMDGLSPIRKNPDGSETILTWDNALIQIENCYFEVIISSYQPPSGRGDFVDGLVVTFLEKF